MLVMQTCHLLLALVCAWPCLSAEQSPELWQACPAAISTPIIDGQLDDMAWQDVRSTRPLQRFINDKASEPLLRTTAQLTWDAQCLYIAFSCEDPDIWSDLTTHDANLWEGEVVEVYLDPEGDGRRYFEFEVNPYNAVLDLCIPKAVNGVPLHLDKARRWQARGFRSAVQVDGTLNDHTDHDRGWTAELAIPFAGLGVKPPDTGDSWRLQLFRIERAHSLSSPQLSAWSPTDTFHHPEHFGRIIFTGKPSYIR